MASSLANPPTAGASLESVSPPRPSRRERWVAPLLFLLSVACYANTILNGFVYDDQLQILANPYIKSWRYLPEIFHTTVWSFIGAAGESNYYRPLMTFTYLLLWKAFGDLPFGYHLFNILLNAMVVVAVYLAGKELFQSTAAGVVAAALFALHPVHTEPVNWIAGIPDLEATLFFVCAFYVYIRRPSLNLAGHFGVLALYLAAMLAKEPAVLLAPLLVWYEHFVRNGHSQTSLHEKASQYLPACGMGALYLIARRILFGNLAPVLQHSQIGWRNGFYSACALVDSYTHLLFWPARLSAFHTFHPSETFSSPGVHAGLLILLLCLVFLAFFFRKFPAQAFCILWIGLTLGPVLNARWMAANVLTERYLYLPSVAFCWLVGRAVIYLWSAWPQQPKLAAVWKAAILIVGFTLSYLNVGSILHRNTEWRDDLTLYLTTLKTDPDSYVMHLNLGTTYFAMHDYRAAERELKIALQLKPGSPNVLNALGCVYFEQGRLVEASQALQQAIAAKPSWTDPHFNDGRVLKKQGKDNAALDEFRTAVAAGPLNASARLYLGEELAARGQSSEAETQLKESIRLLPTLQAQQDLADLLIKTGRHQEAITLLQQMAGQYAYDGPTHLKLGHLLEEKGEKEEALRQFRQCLDVDPENKGARDGVARLETK